VEGHPYGPEPGEEDVEVSNTNPVVAASNKGKKDRLVLLLLVLESTSSLAWTRGSTNT